LLSIYLTMIYRVAFFLLSSAVASADNLRATDSIIDGKKGGGEFCLEKGIRCSGGGVKDEKFGKRCVGGQKFGGKAKTKATELVQSVADGLHEHLHEGYLPTKGEFTPSEEEMQQIMEMEDGLLSIEEGKEKDVEFGGFVKVFWGCNATFSMEDGTASKVVGCGMKSFQRTGKKDNESEIDVGSDDHLRIPDSSFYDDILGPDSGVFRLEKGFRCEGGGVKDEKFGKKCEGGQRFRACPKTKPHDLVQSVADGLHEHMQEGYLPRMSGFMPTENEMEQIIETEDEFSSIEKGRKRKKVVEFGGFVKVFWGCKAAFGKKNGKVWKRVGCGVKSFQGVGKKDDDAIVDVELVVM